MPKLVPVELQIELLFEKNIGEQEKENIKRIVNISIVNYIEGLESGSYFTYNRLVERIMDASQNILDFKLHELAIDDQSIMLSANYFIEADERLVSKYINIT
jgi:hypothetical protein